MATNGSPSKGFNPADLFGLGGEAMRLFGSGQVPLLVKVLPVVLGLLYVASPIDLAPDFVPVLGQMDDAAIVLLALKLFVDFAARFDRGAAPAGAVPAAANTAGTGAPESVSTSYRVR